MLDICILLLGAANLYEFLNENLRFLLCVWMSCKSICVSLAALDKMWVLSTNEKEYPMPATFTSFLLEFGKVCIRKSYLALIFEYLVMDCYLTLCFDGGPQLLTGVIFGNLVFLCVLFYGSRKLLSTATRFYG